MKVQEVLRESVGLKWDKARAVDQRANRDVLSAKSWVSIVALAGVCQGRYSARLLAGRPVSIRDLRRSDGQEGGTRVPTDRDQTKNEDLEGRTPAGHSQASDMLNRAAGF